MSGQWKGSGRKDRLPSNWNRLRKTVLVRDNFTCLSCGRKATEVDHIVRGDDHSLGNLQALCSGCHSKKSSREGADQYKLIKSLRKRPSENHPGLRKPREVNPGGF